MTQPAVKHSMWLEHFTPEQWFLVPLSLRQRWWRETQYSSRAPSAGLVDDVRTIILANSKPPTITGVKSP